MEDEDTFEGHMRFYDGSLAPTARIEGAVGGFFEVGWLEGRRTRRNMYHVQWASRSLELAGPDPLSMLVSGLQIGAPPSGGGLSVQAGSPLGRR